MSKNAKKLFGALMLAACLPLIGCGEKSEAKQGEAEKEEPAIPVEVVEVGRGAIDAAYRGTATLEAEDEAQVLAKQGGVIEQVLVEEGDRVDAGQVLARLETDRLRYELTRAKADMDRLEQDFIRNKSVFQRNLVSREAYERTQYDLQAAQAAYDLARLALKEAEIRAPFDGVVTARYIKRGNQIQPNTEAFRVTQLDRLRAAIYVPERDIHKLKPEHKVTLSTDAWPDEQFAGTVGLVNPVVDPTSGTVKVTVDVADSAGKLRPGMFARAEILYDRREQALLVPKDVVLTEDGSEAVYVLDGERAERREIKLGYADASRYEVTEGLAEGDRVVSTGQANLRDDAKVVVVNDAGPDADAGPTADPAATNVARTDG